jgi:hypothetical protein
MLIQALLSQQLQYELFDVNPPADALHSLLGAGAHEEAEHKPVELVDILIANVYPLRLLQFELRSCVASLDVVAEILPADSWYRSFQPLCYPLFSELFPVIRCNALELPVSVPVWILRTVPNCALSVHHHVRAIADGPVPVAAVAAIRNIGMLRHRRMMNQDAEASFCVEAGYCFKLGLQMNASLKSRDFCVLIICKSASWFQSPN